MKKRSFFHTVRVMFPMAFHAAPLRFILINVLGISQSVVMGANTLLLSNFVNELIASVGKGRFEAALIAATSASPIALLPQVPTRAMHSKALNRSFATTHE